MLTLHHAPEWLAAGQTHGRGFGLAVQDEIAVIGKQVRHLRRGDAEESDLDTSRPHLVGPGRFVAVVDQRRQHQRHVAVGERSAGPHHFVPAAGQDRGDVRHVDAREIVELSLEIRNHRRHARKRIQTRPVAADDGVLTHVAACGFQVRENHPHKSPQMAR